MWDITQYFEQGNQDYPRKGVWKYTRWNDPFKGGIDKFSQVACEGEILAIMEGVGLQFGSYFFTTFVPSPVEIARKTLLGGYRCGFYLGVKVKSPLDIIWRNGEGTKILARIASPFTRALFWAWGTQAIWDGLSTWQSLLYMMYACEGDGQTCICADGAAPINQEGPGSGSMPFGGDVFDPNDWHQGLSGVIHVPALSNTTANAFLDITAAGASISGLVVTLKLRETHSDTSGNSWSGSISDGNQVSFHLASSGTVAGPDFWEMTLEWSDLERHFDLGRIELRLRRIVVRSAPGDPMPDCAPWTPGLTATGPLG